MKKMKQKLLVSRNTDKHNTARHKGTRIYYIKYWYKKKHKWLQKPSKNYLLIKISVKSVHQQINLLR